MDTHVDMALPVMRPELDEAYRTHVLAYQSQQARSWQRSSRRAWWAAGGMLALNVMLGAAIVEMMPLERVTPVFAFMNENGLLDTTTAISDLPPSTTVAGIEALLWQYLRWREGYSASDAAEAYQIVSAMSDDTVRNQYQSWANPKSNRASPASLLRNDGFIRVNRISGGWVSHAPDYTSGVYSIRFCRTIAKQNEDPVQQRMIASISYSLVKDVPFWERVSINPVGVIVTEYPGIEQEGSPGAPHPCVG